MTMPKVAFGIPLITNLIDRQHYRWQIDENVISYWSERSSLAGKKAENQKAGNTAAVEETARHYGESGRLVYRKIAVFRPALTSALLDSAEDPATLQTFCEAVYRDRSSNQRLRFEAAIAAAAAHAQKLQLVATAPGRKLVFHKGPLCCDRVSRNSLLLTEDSGVQALLLSLAQSLVAAAHAAMTGFLDVRGWGERLCRSICQHNNESIFRDDHPDSMWLADVGLSWLPKKPRDETLAARACELQALGFQTIASAYRQVVAYRNSPREQQRYLSLAKSSALKAQRYATVGGVSVTGPFLRTFDVLDNPDNFDLLPWKSQKLGLTEALEIANAGILARRFKEAHAVLDAVMTRIPEWHLPVRSRAVRLQLACQLALGRRAKQLRDEAHQLCALLPHDRHMLCWVESTKGDLRQIYRD